MAPFMFSIQVHICQFMYVQFQEISPTFICTCMYSSTCLPIHVFKVPRIYGHFYMCLY